MTSPPATRGDDARFLACGAYLPETRVPARRHAADNKRGPKGTNLEERGDKIIGAPLTPPPSFLPLVRPRPRRPRRPLPPSLPFLRFPNWPTSRPTDSSLGPQAAEFARPAERESPAAAARP